LAAMHFWKEKNHVNWVTTLTTRYTRKHPWAHTAGWDPSILVMLWVSGSWRSLHISEAKAVRLNYDRDRRAPCSPAPHTSYTAHSALTGRPDLHGKDAGWAAPKGVLSAGGWQSLAANRKNNL
jgi:hypothetical protein